MNLADLIALMPPFQAIMNTAAIVLLSAGYYFVRTGNRAMHRNCMVVTLAVSTVFLVSYLSYHAMVGYQPFAGQGLIRPFYFTLLGSHIVLAAVIVPLVLVTVWYAARGNFERHPRIARWTLPIWLYVSVSGVVVYLLGFHVYAPGGT
jgi:putative membrane protein